MNICHLELANPLTKQGSMVQRPTVLPGILGQIVEVGLSSGDRIAFTENSLG